VIHRQNVNRFGAEKVGAEKVSDTNSVDWEVCVFT